VCVKAGAARGDAEDRESALPCPCFDVFAEAQADLAVTVAVFHDEPADESVWCRLKVVLDGDLDPADDLVLDAGDEGRLVVGARGK